MRSQFVLLILDWVYVSLALSIISRQITHLSVDVEYNEESFEAAVCFRAFQHYFDMEPVGPIIDGDLLVQGYSVSDIFGPSLAVISSMEESEDGDIMYQELFTIPPNRMMINPTDDSDERTRYIIPISLEPEHRQKKIEIKLFVQLKSEFSYDDDAAPDFDSHENRLKMFLSNIIRTGESEGIVNRDTTMEALPELETPATKQLIEDLEADETASKRTLGSKKDKVGFGTTTTEANDEFDELLRGDMVVKDVQIATDYDDVISLQTAGYRLICTGITTTGTVSDQDHLWKFHLLAGYGSSNEAGIEDLQFVKCLKSLGTLPAIPFYNIMHDYDLSSADDDYSVYVATKTGMNPRFKKVVMLSSAYEHEDLLDKYVASVTGAYRPAPKEIQNGFGGSCGVLLLVSENAQQPSSAASVNSRTSQSREGHRKEKHGGVGESSVGTEEDLEEEEDDDDDDYYDDTEEIMRGLEEQVEQLEAEKVTLKNLNIELQKKAVTLMMREKALQGQTAAVRASDMMNQLNGTGTAGGTAGGDTAAAANSTANNAPEQPAQNSLEYMEKEKQYQDTLILIVDERNKLNKQLKEFDQLALDLQTRLDDKEFKAKSIATSFKQFKK
jgi:hypothetical protein